LSRHPVKVFNQVAEFREAECVKILKESVLSRQSPGETEENHEGPSLNASKPVEVRTSEILNIKIKL